MSLEEAEAYIEQSLNALPDEAVDQLCNKMCAWKDEILTETYPDLGKAVGLLEVQGRSILPFISISDIHIYRNPYDPKDPLFGAVLSAGMEWDYEDGIEIIIKGQEVLEVREFLGYGEHSIWEDEDRE